MNPIGTSRHLKAGTREKEASGEKPRILLGVLLCASAALIFACLDIATKKLAEAYNVPLVLFVRYAGNLLLMVAVLAPTRGVALAKAKRPGLALARAACLLVSSLFVGLALQRMPVAETTALVFLAPILVLVLAGPLLGERIGAFGWIAAATGFLGVLLIARPGGGLDALGTACALLSVLLLAAYQLLSRSLAAERSETLLLYVALAGTLGFGLLMPWFLSGEAPTTTQIALFLSQGLAGGIGHFLFTAAYRHAPASTLAPINYLQLLWAALLGWLAFGHAPDASGAAGICVIALSGLVIAARSLPSLSLKTALKRLRTPER